MEELAWRDLLEIIESARSRSQKCTVRVLDTVFVDANDLDNIAWFFTTKNGTISKKKRDKCSLGAVCDRFARFSLANPNNTAAVVCTVVAPDAERIYLNQTEMNTFVNSNKLSMAMNSFLQVYLRPHDGIAHVIRASCIKDVSGRSTIDIYSENVSGPGGVWCREQAELSLEARDQAKYFCHEMNDFFFTGEFALKELQLECILDDNKHLWLSRVVRCLVMRRGSATSDAASAPALPELNRQNSRGNISSWGSNPTISPRVSSSEGRAASGAVTVGPSKLLGKLEGGAVHSCSLAPEDLPGLRAWIVDSMHGDPNQDAAGTTLKWLVDLSAYNSPPSPNPNSAAIYEQRAVVRKSVSHSLLSLVKLAEPILLGDEPIETESDFIARWKFIFRAWVASQNIITQASGGVDPFPSAEDVIQMLRQSSQVTGDGNCHAVCQKLESLVGAGFDITAQTPVGNTGGSRGASAGITERAVRTDGDAVKSANGSMVSAKEQRKVSSAGNNGRKPGDTSISPPLLPGEHHWDNDNISMVSSIGEDSVARFVNKTKQKNEVAPRYALNRDTSPVSNTRTNKKPLAKKKKPIIKQPPSKHEMADMEMLAKFAAEKELQQRLLLQGDDASGVPGQVIADRVPFKETLDSPLTRKPALNGSDAAYLKNQKRKMEFQHQPKGQQKKSGQRVGKESKSNPDGFYEYKEVEDYPQQYLGQEASIASFSSAIVPSPQWMDDGQVADNVSLTGSEANFMMRHAESGDFSHFQSENFPDDDGSAATITNRRKIVDQSHLNSKLSSAMRQRVETLEDQVANLTSRLQKKEDELQRLEEKNKKLNNEKISVVNANNKELARIQEAHERELLRIKNEHAINLSNLVSDPSALEAAAKESSPTGAKDTSATTKGLISRQESTIQATSALIQQLDDMRHELKVQADQHAADRRKYAADFSLKLISSEKAFKIDLQEQKLLTAALEDKLKDTEDALAEIRSQENTSRMLCAQLEAKYKDSVEAQTKLKNDLKIMQASVGNTYKLESAQEIGVGVDADTAIRLAEAKSEAKIRQIQIKCDFMRSQLEAEHAVQEQLQQTIENQKKEYDQLKHDFRTRVREMETEKQQAVEDQERQTELHFEERMLELSSLQSKFHMLQAQLQEAFQDNALSKQREEAAKANALKAQAQQANLRAELTSLKAVVEELRAQKEEGTAKETVNHSNEAMLRRLDNERTYLKSQLSSEMTHKNELQNALKQCQQQLADQQRQWTGDVDSLKATLTRKEEEATLLEQKLSLRISALEGEDARLKSQNAELRDGFKKMRDQLRLEELNTENTRTANRRLLEEVEAGRAELARIKAAEEASNIISQQQASLMSGSLSALEEKAAAEAAHLRSELSKQYVLNAEGQRALLDLKSDFSAERVKLDKKILAGRMVHSMRHLYKNRIAATFRVWYTKSTLLDAASQFKETLQKALARTQEEDRKDAAEALTNLRTQLTSEWNDRVNHLNREHEENLKNVQIEADAQRELSLDDLREEMEAVLRAREAEWAHRHEDAEGWTRTLLDEEAKKKDELERIYIKRAEVEKLRRDEAEAEHIASAKAFALAEAEKNWQEISDRRNIEYQVRMEKAINTVEEAHLNKIKALKTQLAEAQAQALSDQLEKFRAELADVEKKHVEEKEMMQGVHMDEIHDLMGTAQVKHEDAMADLKIDMERAHEQRIRELREHWNEELEQKMAECGAKMTQDFNERAEKLDHSVESERKKAEALEAAKWRQALKDAEKRYKLDLQQVRAQAWNERDQEARLELQGVEADNDRMLQSLKDKHKEILDELKLSHSTEVENMRSRFEVEQAEAVRIVILNTTASLNEKWENEFNMKLVAAEKSAQQQWALKYNKEKELTEKLRGDMAKQTQLHAEERNTLQDKINSNDEILNRLTDDHEYEKKRIERDHERALDNLDIRFQNAKKAWMEEEKKRELEEMENAKAIWEAETKLKVQKVKADMESEMEQEMQKVKDESEHLVTSLEEAMANVRIEKTALVEDLERASERLEELEDAQFDLQQELKLKEKEMSFALWRISTGAMNMKIAFKKMMEDTQEKTESFLECTKETLTKRVQKVTLLAMRLSELLADSESSRISMYESLTQYKSNVLVERRAQIRMTENELDRLTADREVMEEEKNNLLDQIGGKGGLESQVEEVEEQMREHTNSSTVMQNGRINVAHAKKKKRLDNELERLLELIEEKKSQVASLEQRADAVQSEKENKEVVLIDLEKELVQILIDQQRLVLNLVEDGKLTTEKTKHLSAQYNFPWPPVENPSMENAKELVLAIGDL